MADEEQPWNQSLAFLIALDVGQALLWLWLYWGQGPLRRPLMKKVEENPEQKELLIKNYPNSKDPVKDWSLWMIIGLHHGLGALVALIGLFVCLATNSSIVGVVIFQVGLSFEMGEDLLHYVQLAQAIIWPGSNEMFGELYTDWSVRFGVSCHHAIGFFAGGWVFMNIPTWTSVQLNVVVLLGSAVPPLLAYPYHPYCDLEDPDPKPLNRAISWITIIGTIISFALRLIAFPIIATTICIRVADEYSTGAAIGIGVTCGLFMIFVLASLVTFIGEFKNALKVICSEKTITAVQVTEIATAAGVAGTLRKSIKEINAKEIPLNKRESVEM